MLESSSDLTSPSELLHQATRKSLKKSVAKEDHLWSQIQKDFGKQTKNWLVREYTKISRYGSGREECRNKRQGQQRSSDGQEWIPKWNIYSLFTALDGTWCLHWAQSSGKGLPVTSVSHPAKAWAFPLFIFKIEGLYSLLLKDWKICGIQREEKEKITGLEQQIN